MPTSPAYAGFMVLAAAVFLLARRCFPQPGLASVPAEVRFRIALGGFLGGTLGAKLPFALGGDGSGLWMADGKTVTTGLVGSYLGVELAKWLCGVRAKTGDAFAIPLALALAVGRWGCFFHGCCHGTPTDLPWGTDFGDGVRRHPTQVYESLFHLVLAFVLVALFRCGRLSGHRLKLYLIAYAGFRFATEFVRPEPVYAAGLTYFQWVAPLGAGALAAQWYGDTRPAARLVEPAVPVGTPAGDTVQFASRPPQ